MIVTLMSVIVGWLSGEGDSVGKGKRRSGADRIVGDRDIDVCGSRMVIR